MATITRTPRGTATSKASGTTLTIASFTVPAGHCLVVGGCYANGAGAPSSVVHAGRALRRKVQRDNTTDGIHNSIWLKGEYHKDQTGTCTLSWASPIVEKAAFASSFDFVATEDEVSGLNVTVATAAPGTGQTAALDGDEDMVICCFGAEGPGSDHGSATAEIEDGDVFTAATIGQQAGTVGAPPVSNVTVIETFLQLSATDSTRGRLAGATAREWCNTIVALKPRARFDKQGITPSDIVEVEEIVVAAGGNVDDIYFGWNEVTGQWEAYETTSPGTQRAIRDNASGNWSAP